MAERFPQEGLDAILAIVPKGGATVANTYMGLFTGPAGGATVPTFDAVLAAGTGTTPAVEVANANAYARQTIAAASWGANTTQGGIGRRSTAGQVSFPATTSTGWGTVAGFFLASSATYGAGIAYYYANFSDASTIAATSAGFTIQVTPYWEMDE